MNSRIFLNLIVLLLLLIGCGKEQQEPLPTAFDIWFVDLQRSLLSGGSVTINFQWSKTTSEQLTTVGVKLYGYFDGQQTSRVLGYTAIPTQQPGSSSLLWDGKTIWHYGTKAIPVPVGDYTLALYVVGGSWKVHEPVVSIVPNSWDTDLDDISDAVEDENAGVGGGPNTVIIYQGNSHYNWFNKLSADYPPVIPVSLPPGDQFYPGRETHDYSLALGMPSGGTLMNGLRIANSGVGYQYYRGLDPADVDNWGTLALINLVERTGRDWVSSYPGLPALTTMDMSLEGGGYWSDHDSHQNGLDVDIRYIRDDNSSDLVTITDPHYSRVRTQNLINILHRTYNNVVLIYSTDVQLTGVTYDINHANHFHVRITDPDGISN